MLQAFDFAEPPHTDNAPDPLQNANTCHGEPAFLQELEEFGSLASSALLGDSPLPDMQNAAQHGEAVAAEQACPPSVSPHSGLHTGTNRALDEQAQQDQYSASFVTQKGDTVTSGNCTAQSCELEPKLAIASPTDLMQLDEAMSTGTASPDQPSIHQQLQEHALLCSEQDVISDEEVTTAQPEADTHNATDCGSSVEYESALLLQHGGEMQNSSGLLSLSLPVDPFLAYLQTNEQLSPASSASHAELSYTTLQQDKLELNHLADHGEPCTNDSAHGSHCPDHGQHSQPGQSLNHSFSFHASRAVEGDNKQQHGIVLQAGLDVYQTVSDSQAYVAAMPALASIATQVQPANMQPTEHGGSQQMTHDQLDTSVNAPPSRVATDDSNEQHVQVT